MLVVSTCFRPTENISQIGSLPQVGEKNKNLWNHHLDKQIDQTCLVNTLWYLWQLKRDACVYPTLPIWQIKISSPEKQKQFINILEKQTHNQPQSPKYIIIIIIIINVNYPITQVNPTPQHPSSLKTQLPRLKMPKVTECISTLRAEVSVQSKKDLAAAARWMRLGFPNGQNRENNGRFCGDIFGVIMLLLLLLLLLYLTFMCANLTTLQNSVCVLPL